MGSLSQAVQNPARRALSHGALNTMEGADDDRPLSTRVLTGADSPVTLDLSGRGLSLSSLLSAGSHLRVWV